MLDLPLTEVGPEKDEVSMSQDKVARAQAQLVQAFKLRRLSAQIQKEADALESAAAPILAAWDDPAITRDDMGEKGVFETADSAINPKDADELLDLIEDDRSAGMQGEDYKKTKQNKGNNPLKKTKDKWSTEDKPLRQKVNDQS